MKMKCLAQITYMSPTTLEESEMEGGFWWGSEMLTGSAVRRESLWMLWLSL